MQISRELLEIVDAVSFFVPGSTSSENVTGAAATPVGLRATHRHSRATTRSRFIDQIDERLVTFFLGVDIQL
jgi:hypothetical protein